MEFFTKFKNDFIECFIDDSKWKWLIDGLKNTMIITFFALLIGLAIGVVIATIRSTFDKNREEYRKKGGIFYFLWFIVNGICNIYLTVIRGTPVVVQLLIAYFIIFASSRNGVAVAIFAFGLNSGAYVAEIIRGGIMSIDNGQFEAGRSLGFNYVQTMIYIIIPQVFKSVLPTLCNEFIVLIKETSVAGYVGVMDLTKAGDRIRGISFKAFMPLIAVALIYLVVVVVLTQLVKILERRLRKNER
ncbi:MAG: amino acid ABC transporter permease [Clostridia bacterium]|nr:amino acid ABC transporter permease [Clostridia bacterium]